MKITLLEVILSGQLEMTCDAVYYCPLSSKDYQGYIPQFDVVVLQPRL